METVTVPVPDGRSRVITDAANKIKALVDAPAKADRARLADAKAKMAPIKEWAESLLAQVRKGRAEVQNLLDAFARVDFESARVMLRKEDELLRHLAVAERKVAQAREWLDCAIRDLSEVPKRIDALTVADLTQVIIERRYGWGDRMPSGPFRISATVSNYQSGGAHLRGDLDMAAHAFAQVARRLSEEGVLLARAEVAVRPDQRPSIDDAPNDGRVPRQEHAVMAFDVFDEGAREQGQEGAA